MSFLIINTATNTLTASVATATNYVSMNNNSEYMGQLVMSGENGIIHLKATNMIETIIVKQAAFTSNDMTIDSFAPISIDAKKLLKILKASKSDNISFEIHTEKLIVKSGRSKIKIDLPVQVQDISIEMQEDTTSLQLSHKLSVMMDRISHSIAKENPKQELNGASLRISNKILSLASTDTYRLSVASMEIDSKDLNIVIPRRGVISIVKYFGKVDINAKIDKTQITVESLNVIYSVKLVNANFPDYNKMIPNDFNQTIFLDQYLRQRSKE